MSRVQLQEQIKKNPFSPEPYLNLARYLLDEGDEHEARRLIAQRRLMPNQSAAHHASWAQLCEMLGMARQALESWQKAIALDSGNPEYLYHLGVLYYESGSLERALKFLRKALDRKPSLSEARSVLAQLYQELGESGAARAVARKTAAPATHASRHAAPTAVTPQMTVEDVHLLLDLFKGRECGYAEQTIDQAGRAVFTYFDAPLSGERIVDHVIGRRTVGVYALRTDNTLQYAAVRVFIIPRRLMDNRKNPVAIQMMEDNAHTYSTRLQETAQSLGVSCYVTAGGEHDRRVWFFFKDFLPAQLAKNVLEKLLAHLPAVSSDLSLEIYCGTEITGTGWQICPVIMPLGINQKTGVRCFFLDAEGCVINDQLAYVHRIKTIALDTVKKLISPTYQKTTGQTEDLQVPVLDRLTRQCVVMGELIGKARSGRMLTEQEKLVIYFTAGFLPDNGRALHYILEMTPDYRPDRVDKQRGQLRSNPVSCPKIRALLPHLTAYLACNCALSIPAGGYPSPLIHVDPSLVAGKRLERLTAGASLQENARRYVLLHREVTDLLGTLAKLENQLLAQLRQKQLDAVNTPFGCLKSVNGRLHIEPQEHKKRV